MSVNEEISHWCILMHGHEKLLARVRGEALLVPTPGIELARWQFEVFEAFKLYMEPTLLPNNLGQNVIKRLPYVVPYLLNMHPVSIWLSQISMYTPIETMHEDDQKIYLDLIEQGTKLLSIKRQKKGLS